jgi:hypothetical protein
MTVKTSHAMALTPLELSRAASSTIKTVGHTDSAQELLEAAGPQHDLHLMHLAIIVQRQ